MDNPGKEIFDHGGNVYALARALGVPPEELIDFSASINPLGYAPGVREAVLASFDRIIHYPDREATEFRRALADFHGLEPDRIAVANGSTELIYLIPRLLPGKRGLIATPAFSEYGRALERAGWETACFTLSPSDGFAFDLGHLAECLAGGFDLLFLCNPANPTGALLPLEIVREIHSICQRAGTFLVLDEAFMDFSEAESAKHLIAGCGGGVVLRSMTKFFAIPGLRLGYAIGPTEMIQTYAAMMEPWSVNTIAQIAGLASLADAEYRKRTILHAAAERAFLAGEIAKLPGFHPWPSSANYLLVELRNSLTAAELRDGMLRRGIIIRDCSNFEGLDGRFFRLAVRTNHDNRLLLSALEEYSINKGGYDNAGNHD